MAGKRKAYLRREADKRVKDLQAMQPPSRTPDADALIADIKQCVVDCAGDDVESLAVQKRGERALEALRAHIAAKDARIAQLMMERDPSEIERKYQAHLAGSAVFIDEMRELLGLPSDFDETEGAWRNERAGRAEAERDKLKALNQEWAEKAATWMASPEAAALIDVLRNAPRLFATDRKGREFEARSVCATAADTIEALRAHIAAKDAEIENRRIIGKNMYEVERDLHETAIKRAEHAEAERDELRRLLEASISLNRHVEAVNEGIAKFNSAVERQDVLRAERDAALAELAWYGEQARLARLIHSEGDAGRHALANDGGKRARTVLAAAAHPAQEPFKACAECPFASTCRQIGCHRATFALQHKEPG